jgi:hypothetical protein
VHSELFVRRFTDVEITFALAGRMRRLVESIEDRLRVEMPQVLPRYANIGVARSSMQDVQKAMNRNRGFVAYLVMDGNSVLGVVSCDQRRLTTPRRWYGFRPGTELACGPLIAGWLGNMSRQPRLMTDVLRLLSPKLAANPHMTGSAWTLVRVGHEYVENTITDTLNGFGGFEPQGVESYKRVDGLDFPRQLYVASHSLQERR